MPTYQNASSRSHQNKEFAFMFGFLFLASLVSVVINGLNISSYYAIPAKDKIVSIELPRHEKIYVEHAIESNQIIEDARKDDAGHGDRAQTEMAKIIHHFEDAARVNSNFADLHTTHTNTHTPFLVVCDEIFDPLIPMFNNFTLIRLNKNGIPPPWNATVFLQIMHKNTCANHPYVVESIERRIKSPFLDALVLFTNRTGEWNNGVHWPHISVVRTIQERPAIVGFRGEVFWRDNYGSCSDFDFVVYRETENPCIDSFTIHYLQGVSTISYRGEEGEFDFHNTQKILEQEVTHPHKPPVDLKYDKFCSFIAKRWSGLKHPTHMFNHSNYDIDAIVRHVFFRRLSEYKPCERVVNCLGNLDPYNSFKCMVGFKFHINMENTLMNGYISEKVFNGAMAGGIPVYFGAPDIANYVNIRSIIHCAVSREVIEEMRSFYPRTGEQPRYFFFNNRTTSSPWPTDEELFAWVDNYLHPQLEPCVKRVIELDKNDTAFREVLDEPFITNKDIMSGEYPLLGVEQAYNVLKNWNTNNDYVRTLQL